jgi:hypothetical protein
MTTIRELTPADLPFLRRMLYTALFWRPGRLRIPSWLVLRHPAAAMYHRGWGRSGDTGFVAEKEGRPGSSAPATGGACVTPQTARLRRYGIGDLILIRDFLRFSRELNEAHLTRLKGRSPS